MSTGALADATIVFDLDGTLVDSAPDLVRALNETLDLEGLPRVDVERVRRLIGNGARVLIERASAAAGAHFSPERLDQLTKAFIDFYRADIAGQTAPFPGLESALDALTAEGARLSVCTNKRTDLSLQVLDALGLTLRFAAIVGADGVPHKKPHPDHYRAAVERAGGTVARSLMIGDTSTDVAAARGAGAPVALVRFGYSDDEIEKLGADAILDRYAELPLICGQLLAARP